MASGPITSWEVDGETRIITMPKINIKDYYHVAQGTIFNKGKESEIYIYIYVTEAFCCTPESNTIL